MTYTASGAAGYVMGAQITADKQSGPTEQELLAAEHHAALREAFAALPPSGQRLIALLLAGPGYGCGSWRDSMCRSSGTT